MQIISLPQAYRYTWRHLACYAFIKIKFASHIELNLFYVVYVPKIIEFHCCIQLQAKMKGGIILVGPACSVVNGTIILYSIRIKSY